MTAAHNPTPDYIDAANAALDLRAMASAFVPFDGLDFLIADRRARSEQSGKGIKRNRVSSSHQKAAT